MIIVKTILDKTTGKGFRYRLQQFPDKFVIFSLDTKIILSQRSSEMDWREVEVFSDETKAREALDKLLEK